MMRLARLALVAAAISYACPSTVLADKATNSLNVAWATELNTLDRYFNVSPEINIVQNLIFDTLIYRDPDTLELKPLIASSWKWVDGVTLEVEIRKGIRFQNGDALTADDVVYTLNWLADEKNVIPTRNNVSWLNGAEKTGEDTVRIKLKHPFPAALQYLSGPIPIYPAKYHAEVGPKVFGEKPIGSGPFKVTSVNPGRTIVFERNNDYWQGSPKGKPSIQRISQRTIPDPNTQVAELLSGSIDWIWRVPEDQANRLKTVPIVQVQSTESLRFGFLLMDASGRTPNSPFVKREVREAVAMAIDRAAMSQQLAGQGSRPLQSLCFPLQFGCTEEGVARIPFDVAGAKKLMAAGGYPDGFDVDLYAFSFKTYSEAVITYLRAIGIRANLRFMQFPALLQRLQAGEIPFVHMNWGSYGVADVSAVVSEFFKGGPSDYARDEEVKGYLEKADSSIDPEERKKLYQAALQKIAKQAYAVPMFSYVSLFAFAKDLDFPPQKDEFAHLYRAKWK
jgi:peptide/nickel transport system substrate-binding protein